MYVKWSSDHKTNIQDIMYLKEKEKKRYKKPHYIPQYTLPLSPILTLPL